MVCGEGPVYWELNDIPTELAATFGFARNSEELLMDPNWTQIALRRNCQFLVRSEELPVCFQAVSKGFECHRFAGRQIRKAGSEERFERYGFPQSRFSKTQAGSEPFAKFPTPLLFSAGYKSVDLIRLERSRSDRATITIS